MQRRILTLLLVLAAAGSSLAGSAALTGCQARPAAAQLPWYSAAGVPAAARRVGTIDRTELLIAYYGSAQFDAHLQHLHAQHDAARAAGDATLAAQLERQGEQAQEHAHRQLAGKDSLDDILIKIEDLLARVCTERKLDLIVEAGTWTGADAQVIDVTQTVVEKIPARRAS